MSEKAGREKQVLRALKQLQQQLEQQEQSLNEVLEVIKKDPLPSLPQPSKLPFVCIAKLIPIPMPSKPVIILFSHLKL